ncbi:MAG: methyltransferase [Bacteroidales bacterium]|nr:methyltransferase [Bacteroidales bacterium]
MSNSYFQFKQFVVNQDMTAMKVGTDGVLLGVLSARNAASVSRVLDIGTGTGLVALMLAQRFPMALVDAVEIDTDAYNQALRNFADSPFSSRLAVHCSDIADYNTTYTYNIIVSNPPYFVDSLKAPDQQRTVARHAVTLTVGKLAESVSRLLSDDGEFSVIIPNDLLQNYIDAFALHKLYPEHIVEIKPNERKPVKRVVATFSRELVVSASHEELILESEPRKKSLEFSELVSPFYLK